MNQTIAKLITDYSRQDKNINEEFIAEVMKIVLANDNLADYLYVIQPVKSFGFFTLGAMAAYGPVNKVISYNYQKLLAKGIKKNKQIFSNVKLSNTYLYLFILQMLLHEIEHARQFRKIFEMKTPEDYLLSQELHFLNTIMNTLKNGSEDDAQNIKILAETLDYTGKRRILYEFSPAERLADIHAKEQVSDIANYLENSKYQEMMLYDYYQALLRGYYLKHAKHKVVVPTKYFFDNMDKPFVWNEIIERTTNLDELERIKLGLEVNQEALKVFEQKRDTLILKLKRPAFFR